VAADPDKGELYVLSKALPTMMRLVMPGVSQPDASRTGPLSIVSAEDAARLTSQANEALAKGSVRFTWPYAFLFTSTYLSPIGTPWSEIVAYDLNTGDVKWRVPHGSVTTPAELGILPESGAHCLRGGLLLTGGGLLLAASGSDKTMRAYDRRTGHLVWTQPLPAACDGVPAFYEVGGRRYILVPAAAGHGWNAARFPTLASARELLHRVRAAAVGLTIQFRPRRECPASRGVERSRKRVAQARDVRSRVSDSIE
jgi:quinoprotein glucose dehydrogenase